MFMWRDGENWEVDEQEWETERLNPEPKEIEELLEYFFQGDAKGAKQFKKAIGK